MQVMFSYLFILFESSLILLFKFWQFLIKMSSPELKTREDQLWTYLASVGKPILNLASLEARFSAENILVSVWRIGIVHVLVEPDSQVGHLALAEVRHPDVPTIPDTGHLESSSVSLRGTREGTLRYRLFDLLLNPSSLNLEIISPEI